MNKTELESLFQNCLTDQKIQQLLTEVDADLAKKTQECGCTICSGKLHRANYRRKPRGLSKQERGNEQKDVYRDSFCCNQEGCRKRHTPPSVRFLGRKVYWGFIVVLLSAMQHGLSEQRLKTLREVLGVDKRTVERWRQWWLGTFARGSFWKAARARFSPRVAAERLPLSLCEVFKVGRLDRLLELLKFLAPITTGSIPLKVSM